MDSRTNLLRHLIRPARGGAIAVIIVFAFLLFIAAKGGFIGIPLALLVTSWFFKYAYILFDHTARGFDEPPTLDIQMMNPVDEQRPLAQMLILCVIGALLYYAHLYIGMTATIALGVVCLFFLPASAAILGLESHLLKAANPLEWLSLVRGLGSLYGAVLLVIFGYVVLLRIVGNFDLWPPVAYSIGMFAILSVFSFLAGCVYERRHELNLETWVSPERTRALADKQAQREHDKVVLEAYGLMRANAHIKCWQTLVDWLQNRGNMPEDYGWLCERTVSWDDPRYVTRLTEDYVSRLLTLKRTGEALDAVSKRLHLDPNFRPRTAADTLTVAQLAARGGGAPKVARILLSDFAGRFVGDPRVAVANALKSHLEPHAP
jgi:hypothetical protein